MCGGSGTDNDGLAGLLARKMPDVIIHKEQGESLSRSGVEFAQCFEVLLYYIKESMRTFIHLSIGA
jgi:hypothetical protein